MRCCAAKCDNDSVTEGERDDITFHNFPKDKLLYKEWTKVVGHNNTDTKDSVICSDHFRDEDYCIRNGVRELKHGAVPFCDKKTSDETLQVCRICLARNTKMASINNSKLDSMYQKLTGIDVHENANYPQYFCWECAARLKTSVAFKQKALRAETIMKVILGGKKHLTEKDIKSINRRNMKLKSTLIQTHLEPEEFLDDPNERDMLLRKRTKEPEDLLKIKTENSESDERHSSDEVQITKRKKISMEKLVDNKIARMKKEEENALQDSEDDFANALMDRYKSAGKNANLSPLDSKIFIETDMSFEKQILDMRKRRDSKSYKSARHKCSICYLVVKNNAQLVMHMKKHSHETGEFVCLICKTRRKTFKGLRDHINNFHLKLYTCKLCTFMTKIRYLAKQHQNRHTGATHRCPHCRAQFVAETSYLSHLRTKHISDFVCELCGYTFDSEKGIEVHKKMQHADSDDSQILDGPYCDVCDVKFLTEKAYERHVKLSSKHAVDSEEFIDSKDQEEACDQCGHSFINHRGLALHRRVLHKGEIVEVPPDGPHCAECDVRFINEEALRVHLSAAQKHGAPLLRAKTPINRSKLEKVERKPVECKECGLQLKDVLSYNSHVRTAHNSAAGGSQREEVEKSFECEECGRGFTDLYRLRDHRWMHSEVTPFKCEICGKMFRAKAVLMTHKKLHSDHKPAYVCSICSKTFSTPSNRLKHMYIHSGIKPYKCDLCEKAFKLPSDRKTHIKHAHLKVPWPKGNKKRNAEKRKQNRKNKVIETKMKNDEVAMKNDEVECNKVVMKHSAAAMKFDEIAVKSDKKEKNINENVFLRDDVDEIDEHISRAEVTPYGASNNEAILGDSGGEDCYEEYEALDDDFDNVIDNDELNHHVDRKDEIIDEYKVELQVLDDEDY